jgi:hypothetical protein
MLLSVESDGSHALFRISRFALTLVKLPTASDSDFFVTFVDILNIEPFSVIVAKVRVLGFVFDVL